MAKVEFNTERCKGCGLCVLACPKKIVFLSDVTNKNGYNVATVEKMDECIGCANCAVMCPDSVIEVDR